MQMVPRIHAGMISLIALCSLATAPAVAQTPPPAGPGGAAGRAATRPSVTVAPPADAIEVELAPPLDKDGNFKVAPKTKWADVPPIEVKEGTPRGTLSTFSVKSEDTKLFPGVNGAYVRNVWVYVPAGYVAGKELPLMVDHDGRADSVIQTQLI